LQIWVFSFFAGRVVFSAKLFSCYNDCGFFPANCTYLAHFGLASVLCRA